MRDSIAIEMPKVWEDEAGWEAHYGSMGIGHQLSCVALLTV